ncbi:MAG: tetratricopeptide repeat protein [Alphaproteobacteria bacterium]
MKNLSLKNLTSALAITALIALGACAPHEKAQMKMSGKHSAIDSLRGKHTETVERLSTSAQDAIAEGKETEALALYKRLYEEKPKEDVAVNYAQLLRKTGNPQKASDVLAKFVNGKKAKQGENGLVLNEYAATQIALGNFDDAAEKLDRVLADGSTTAYQADASNLKGVVYDAQGRHKEAEGLFRVAMEGWEGNPTSVMNNLALCLANQGRFDEALDILRRALVMAPDKQEIARNINLIGDLRTNVVPAAPVKLKAVRAVKKEKDCSGCPIEPAKP